MRKWPMVIGTKVVEMIKVHGNEKAYAIIMKQIKQLQKQQRNENKNI